MNHVSLFSGIGGIDLAAHWAGMTTVAFCERDPYCQRVLAKHWPGVPIIDDIHHVTKQSLSDLGVDQINIISGGFPCQPYSFAGKRRGNEDDRALWPQMLRVVSEVRPSWVLGENVAGVIDLALDDVLASLEAEGYEARAVVFPACAVGASHIRQRVFIVAHAESIAKREPANKVDALSKCGETRSEPGRNGESPDVPDSQSERREETRELRHDKPAQWIARSGEANDACWRADPRGSQWATEPNVGRVAYGVPNAMDRMRVLGNAVVPQQVYPILAEIARLESMKV
jgi:DNA (cytosine-5)-methyltransferase 1